MDFLGFLIYGLATWRISSLLVNEAGPWEIFLRLRRLMGIEHDKGKQKTIIPDGFFAGLFSCIWCMSLWVGLGFFLSAQVWPPQTLSVSTVLAFSTVAILVQSYLEK